MLHTRLHQCTWQQETISCTNIDSSQTNKSKGIYHADTPDTPYAIGDPDSFLPLDFFDVLYNNRGPPYFKRRIMRDHLLFPSRNTKDASSIPIVSSITDTATSVIKTHLPRNKRYRIIQVMLCTATTVTHGFILFVTAQTFNAIKPTTPITPRQSTKLLPIQSNCLKSSLVSI